MMYSTLYSISYCSSSDILPPPPLIQGEDREAAAGDQPLPVRAGQEQDGGREGQDGAGHHQKGGEREEGEDRGGRGVGRVGGGGGEWWRWTVTIWRRKGAEWSWKNQGGEEEEGEDREGERVREYGEVKAVDRNKIWEEKGSL